MVSSSSNLQKAPSLVTASTSRVNTRVSGDGAPPFAYRLTLGIDNQPLPQLNPKKKIFEAIQPGMFSGRQLDTPTNRETGFITLDTKEAAWVNPETKSVHKIRTAKGVCVAPTLVGASLS